jgi:hypothetical protein
LLTSTLQLQQVQVARARVVDTRPAQRGAAEDPENLRLPWRVDVESLKVASLSYQGRMQLEAAGLEADYAFDGLHHRARSSHCRWPAAANRGELRCWRCAPLTLDAQVAGRFTPPVPRRPLRAAGPAGDGQGPADAIA